MFLQQGSQHSGWRKVSYRGSLQNLLIVPLQLEGLLEVQVGGSQRDGQVDTAYVGQDCVLGESLQSHARVLPNQREPQVPPSVLRLFTNLTESARSALESLVGTTNTASGSGAMEENRQGQSPV